MRSSYYEYRFSFSFNRDYFKFPHRFFRQTCGNLYRDLLKAKPDSLAIKKKLTELFIVKGELQKAWAFTHEIAKAQPGDTDATYFYGRLHLAQKEWARAAEVLFYATRDAPSFAFAHYFLRLARLGTNNIRKAKMAFLRAKELFPVRIKPRIALAQIMYYPHSG